MRIFLGACTDDTTAVYVLTHEVLHLLVGEEMPFFCPAKIVLRRLCKDIFRRGIVSDKWPDSCQDFAEELIRTLDEVLSARPVDGEISDFSRTLKASSLPASGGSTRIDLHEIVRDALDVLLYGPKKP